MADDECSLLVARAQHHVCGVRLEIVREVTRALALRRLDGLPPYVRGASIIRAEATPVVDLSVLFGGAPLAAPRRYLVLRGASPVALAVDRIDGVRRLARSALGGLPRLLTNYGSEHIASIASLDGDLLPVLTSAVVLPEAHDQR